MINLPKTKPGWSRGRFWGFMGALLALQAGLILLFAGRGQRTAAIPAATSYFGVLGTPLTTGQLSQMFFALDPTVFPWPGRHGFSGRAWLLPSDQKFEAFNETVGPAWLALNTARLGTNFSQINSTGSLLPFEMMDGNDPELEPWPSSLPAEITRVQSRCEIQGELARRQLTSPPELGAWPPGRGALVLTNSTVQIAVDSAGQVVAARLLAPSGSIDADTNALASAWNLRFRPVPVSRPVWGKAVFEWQTVARTNAASAPLP
jgi:hypothetical protein